MLVQRKLHYSSCPNTRLLSIQRTLFGNVVVNMHCCIHNNTATKTDNLLYVNIDQILPNKLHGPMHYKIGVICVYSGHVFYTLLLYYFFYIYFFTLL